LAYIDLQDVSVDSVSDIPPRKPLDVELNSHGKQLMDVMKSLELGTLNGIGAKIISLTYQV